MCCAGMQSHYFSQRLGATLVTLVDRLADPAKALGINYEKP